MKIKIINRSLNPLPAYKTAGSVGMDLCANEDFFLHPGHTAIIKTGIYMEIPDGYEVQVRPRSGLSAKGVMVAFGTIDSDYRGEVGVIMTCLARHGFKFQVGDRIAQLVVSKVEIAELEEVEVLSETVRGEGGFGSTGK